MSLTSNSSLLTPSFSGGGGGDAQGGAVFGRRPPGDIDARGAECGAHRVVGQGSGDSLLAIIGTWLAPIFAPLGFGDWRVATALVTGLMAKEAVISTLGVLMGVGANLGSAALGSLFTLPSAVSFLVFCLLYTPCVAALAALRRELGSGVKTVLVMASQCCVAWLAAFCVYTLIGVIL